MIYSIYHAKGLALRKLTPSLPAFSECNSPLLSLSLLLGNKSIFVLDKLISKEPIIIIISTLKSWECLSKNSLPLCQ